MTHPAHASALPRFCVIGAFGFAVDAALLQLLIDLLAMPPLAARLVSILVAWYGYAVFQSSLEMGARTLSPLATPVAIPQFLWAVGLAFFVFVCLMLLVRASLALITGDLDTVQRLIGPRSLAQELRQEVETVARHRVDDAGHER